MYHLPWKIHLYNYIKYSDVYRINKRLLKRNKKKQNQTRKWNCLLSLVRTKSVLTLLHRCDECKLSKYRLDISAFRDKEFKGHAHLNSIQLYFTFFSKADWVITFNFAMLAFFYKCIPFSSRWKSFFSCNWNRAGVTWFSVCTTPIGYTGHGNSFSDAWLA